MNKLKKMLLEINCSNESKEFYTLDDDASSRLLASNNAYSPDEMCSGNTSCSNNKTCSDNDGCTGNSACTGNHTCHA